MVVVVAWAAADAGADAGAACDVEVRFGRVSVVGAGTREVLRLD
jgi:hypothetical protein